MLEFLGWVSGPQGPKLPASPQVWRSCFSVLPAHLPHLDLSLRTLLEVTVSPMVFPDRTDSQCSPVVSCAFLDSRRRGFVCFIGTPLQYSCLENPMDGGAWWVAVHGVTQSQTRLKPLSSNSSSCCCWVVLLLLLSHFSRVRLCATPETAAHQASPSLGFSRQEHWSGLPFPSPMHESEK